MDQKKDFLVSYDFGKAGLWAVVTARSAQEIKAKSKNGHQWQASISGDPEIATLVLAGM